MKETKAVTIIDVAAAAGVSKATVGRVIGNYGNVSLKSRAKVQEAIAQLGYSQNAIAQGLRAKSTRTIGVVVGDITNNFCNRLLGTVERLALQKGFDVLFGNSAEQPAREYELLSNLKARRVDGIVLISCVNSARFIPRRYVDLYTSLPIVMADRRVNGLKLDIVTSNNEASAYHETTKLIGFGHRRIGVVFYSEVSTIADRYAGYQRAVRDGGLEVDPGLVLSTPDIKGLSSQRVERFLEDNPDMTAVILFNNSILPTLLRAMRKLGRAVGEDISIISWDDDDINDLMEIDTVTQQVDQIGETAMERLLRRIDERQSGGGKPSGDDPITITLDTTTIRRSSCRALTGA